MKPQAATDYGNNALGAIIDVNRRTHPPFYLLSALLSSGSRREQLCLGEGGKRVRDLRELRREEREMKLRSYADDLDSMMEGEQLCLAEGGKRLRALWEPQRE